jgi:hypothetical protein
MTVARTLRSVTLFGLVLGLEPRNADVVLRRTQRNLVPASGLVLPHLVGSHRRMNMPATSRCLHFNPAKQTATLRLSQSECDYLSV